MKKDNYFDLSREIMLKILDNLYNEIHVHDKDGNIIYVNNKCYEHYGLKPEEMIGKNESIFLKKYWYPSSIPIVNKQNRRVSGLKTTLKVETFV